MRTIQLTSESQYRRLDAFLAENTQLTRSHIQKVMADGGVTVNGKVVTKASTSVKEDAEIVVTLPEEIPLDIPAQNIPLDIVYQDEHLAVINKSQGMTVHPANNVYTDTLVNALLYHVTDLSGINGVLRPGIVHRLDKDTSGLLVVAKNDSAHLFLSDQLKERKMGRIYETVVYGNVREDTFTVDMPIGRHPTDRKKMAVVSNGRNAVTHGEVIRRFYTSDGAFTHLRLRLETGRTHQIRVHMAKKGHPVIGDTVYGGDHNKFAQRNAGILCGQCLHARTLEIVHPKSGEVMSFDGGLPDYFTAILKKLDNMDQK